MTDMTHGACTGPLGLLSISDDTQYVLVKTNNKLSAETFANLSLLFFQ